MASFQIKVRNLESSETLIATLDSLEDAVTYLEDRPKYIEVITILSSTSVKEKGKLQEAMRPYDPEERALIKKHSAEMEVFVIRQREEAMKALAAAEDRDREEAKTADPNRVMRVHWDIKDGFSPGDDYDERPITDSMKKAIDEWVTERNTWVEDRGQYVIDATVQIWPNEKPEGEEDRIMRGGSFTPALKPDAFKK